MSHENSTTTPKPPQAANLHHHQAAAAAELEVPHQETKEKDRNDNNNNNNNNNNNDDKKKDDNDNSKERDVGKEVQSRIFSLLQEKRVRSSHNNKDSLPEPPRNLGTLLQQVDPLATAGSVPYPDQNTAYWMKQYPQLDEETTQALLEHADEPWPDRYPKHILVALGAHYVDQHWTETELQRRCFSLTQKSTGKIKTIKTKTRQDRATLYGTLACRVLTESYRRSDEIGEMLHHAQLLNYQSLENLQKELLQEMGYVSPQDKNDDDDKASVIVTLIQHLYPDLLPAVDADQNASNNKNGKRAGNGGTTTNMTTTKQRRT